MSRQVKKTEIQKLQSKVRKLQTELREAKLILNALDQAIQPAVNAWRDETGPVAVDTRPETTELIAWLMDKYDQLQHYQVESAADLGAEAEALGTSDFDSATEVESIEEVVAKNEEGAKEFLQDEELLNKVE